MKLNLSIATFLLYALVVCAFRCPPQGIPSGVVSNRTIPRPEGIRQYRVFVPSNYINTKPVPVVYSFHGLGDNCDNFIAATGLQQYATSRDFILIAPCGTEGELGNAWNSGVCCGFPGSVPDDVQFTRDIYADVSSNLCVDASRVYSTGFSNGAFMSEILACNASDLFRAVASVSGVVELRPGNAGGLQVCDQIYAANKANVGVINIHGTFDFVVPWTGDEFLGFPPIPTDMTAWSVRANCTKGPVQTLANGTFSNQVWYECGAGNRSIELVKNEGGGHEWPEGPNFDTTGYIVEFLLDRN